MWTPLVLAVGAHRRASPLHPARRRTETPCRAPRRCSSPGRSPGRRRLSGPPDIPAPARAGPPSSRSQRSSFASSWHLPARRSALHRREMSPQVWTCVNDGPAGLLSAPTCSRSMSLQRALRASRRSSRRWRSSRRLPPRRLLLRRRPRPRRGSSTSAGTARGAARRSKCCVMKSRAGSGSTRSRPPRETASRSRSPAAAMGSSRRPSCAIRRVRCSSTSACAIATGRVLWASPRLSLGFGLGLVATF